MAMDPLTANRIGIKKSCPTRVNSMMSTTAVIGIFMDEARNAAAPMIAKAPSDVPGQKIFHTPPRIQASSAPLDNPGVSKPPCAPARNVPQVISTFPTSNTAANITVISLLKLICAGPLPLPSSSGNPPANRPIMAKLIRLYSISLASRGACAFALLVSRVNRNAATPNTGPMTTANTSSDGVIASANKWYWDSLLNLIHATSAAMADVHTAGSSNCQLNAPSSTSSTNTAPPSGTL